MIGKISVARFALIAMGTLGLAATGCASSPEKKEAAREGAAKQSQASGQVSDDPVTIDRSDLKKLQKRAALADDFEENWERAGSLGQFQQGGRASSAQPGSRDQAAAPGASSCQCSCVSQPEDSAALNPGAGQSGQDSSLLPSG